MKVLMILAAAAALSLAGCHRDQNASSGSSADRSATPTSPSTPSRSAASGSSSSSSTDSTTPSKRPPSSSTGK